MENIVGCTQQQYRYMHVYMGEIRRLALLQIILYSSLINSNNGRKIEQFNTRGYLNLLDLLGYVHTDW